jgi:glucose-6-phosphate isomerase
LIELLEFLRHRNPIINVVSKSGTTTESGIAFRVLRRWMEERYGKEAVSRIVVTTDPQSGALRALANKFGYRCFPVPPDMGGRYSVLSAVGLLPLALVGHPIEMLLEGANACFRALDEISPASNPVLQYAAARVAAYQSGKNVEVLSLSEPKMVMFGEWWKQLFGESEGKDGQGIFPAVTTFTTDLHSMGQFLQEGKQIFFETFLSVASTSGVISGGVEQRLRIPQMPEVGDGLGYLEGKTLFEINSVAMQATRIAHREAGVPCLEISLRSLDHYCLGGFVAFMEVTCAVSALSIGVNPFDQPGVEAYKNNLFALLGKPGYEGLGARLRGTY